MPAILPVSVSGAHVGDLSIDDLAAATGVSRDDLRLYEARGLVRVRRWSNGYRAYPPEIVELMQYVRTAQQPGFTLVKIEEDMSHVRQQPNADAAIIASLRDKLAMIDARIASLQAIRNTLATRVGMACPLTPA